MRRSFFFAAVLGFSVIAGGVSVDRAFAEAPATQPAKKPYTPLDRITGVYAKLTLTPDQEAKILAIQKDEKIKTRKIEDDAEAAIMLVLDDKQKKQLDDMEKEQKEKTKAHQAEKRKEEKAEKDQKKAEPAKAEPAKDKK